MTNTIGLLVPPGKAHFQGVVRSLTADDSSHPIAVQFNILPGCPFDVNDSTVFTFDEKCKNLRLLAESMTAKMEICVWARMGNREISYLGVRE